MREEEFVAARLKLNYTYIAPSNIRTVAMAEVVHSFILTPFELQGTQA
jgi:hypothetical protein